MHHPTPISPKTHGIIDYATSSALALAPRILDMPKREAAFTYGLAAGMAGLAAFTKTPVSAKGIVPLKAHAATDTVLGVALPFVPALMHLNKKDGKNARYFFGGLAGMIGGLALLTNWNSTQRRAARKSRRTNRQARKSSRQASRASRQENRASRQENRAASRQASKTSRQASRQARRSESARHA